MHQSVGCVQSLATGPKHPDPLKVSGSHGCHSTPTVMAECFNSNVIAITVVMQTWLFYVWPDGGQGQSAGRNSYSHAGSGQRQHLPDCPSTLRFFSSPPPPLPPPPPQLRLAVKTELSS